MSKSPVIISAAALGVILIEGDDARTFLQGQTTPDLRKVHSGDCVFGAFCNAQGRVIATGWFQGIENGFRLIISRDLVTTLTKRLRMYVLRAKVLITDASDLHPIWVLKNDGAEFKADWKIEGPEEIALAAADKESLPSDSLILEGDALTLTMIQAGIPVVTQQTTERFIPHMLSLGHLGGLSFDKGCYTGQEIVTRTQFLGKVKRTLHRFSSDTAKGFEPGASILSVQTQEVLGEVFLSAELPGGGTTGLAVLKNDAHQSESLHIGGHRLQAIPVAND